ncbi:MAG: hypothetical protein EBT39_02335 [Sphingobacteriia bacterium]|nr:hypothetical protein [Candidatus Fonsibacter lacus]
MVLFETQTLIKIDNPKINTGFRFQSFILSITKRILIQFLIQNIKISPQNKIRNHLLNEALAYNYSTKN